MSGVRFMEAEMIGPSDMDAGLRALLGVLLLLCMLTVSPLIYSWLWGVLLLVMLWGAAQFRERRLRGLWSLFMPLTVGGYPVGVLFSQGHWLSAESVTGFIVLVAALKLVEARRKRESLWLLALGIVLAGIGTLYWSSLAGLAYILLLILGLVIAMVVMARPGRSRWRRSLILSGRLFGFALPMALLLFFIFPRFPGPLWDLGLSFGMPLTLTATTPPEPPLEGNRLRGDKLGSFLTQAVTVLVAKFDSKVPYKSELYWRGPVFYLFDGVEWALPEGALRRSELMRGQYSRAEDWTRDIQTETAQGLGYEVRVMPHGQRWLYGLDLSEGGSPETFISRDLQLLSIRELNQEFSYRSTAYLHYRAAPPLDQDSLRGALEYPPGNPRLKALGVELATQYPDPEERIRKIYQWLRANYGKTEEPAGDASDALDRLWFERAQGNLLDTASAVALILRASGLPVRLISGYRGGTLVALTDFVIVKQANSHVWLETWIKDRGWVRVEPQDYIGIQRAREPADALTTTRSGTDKKEGSAAEEFQTPRTHFKKAHVDAHPNLSLNVSTDAVQADSASSSLVAGWFGLIDDWMIHYDPGKQMDLFQQFGRMDLSSVKLFVIALAGLLLLGVGLMFSRGISGFKTTDPVQRSFRTLQARLRRIVPQHPGECPSQYAKRLQIHAPETAQVVAPLIERYLKLRYGANRDTPESRLFVTDVKRTLGILG
jgi:protein-glutamine gamma-glutamyltransferase